MDRQTALPTLEELMPMLLSERKTIPPEPGYTDTL